MSKPRGPQDAMSDQSLLTHTETKLSHKCLGQIKLNEKP